MGAPQTRDFYKPWGFDLGKYQAAWDDYKRQRDLDATERWGFPPQLGAGVMRAADRGEADFSSAMESLGGMEQEILGGSMARGIEDYYTKLSRGEMDPFTPGVLSSISSRITDPFYRSARSNIAEARANFASRGLGRSGGLIDMENQYMTDAISRSLSENAGVQSQGAIENARFRVGGMGQYQSYQQQRNAALSDLAQQRASLFAGRQHDPTVEAMRGSPRRNITRGYAPPPQPQARSYGQSAPTYQV